ncbi:MAG TPA: imidazoleglycerol-phosphate dehydratase HisB [Candidatus Limnocylindria bacterium]|nr:imidazoleglycerol-phosphate dehydratase HisB [Candidatus Limnocylindria bacterium]
MSRQGTAERSTAETSVRVSLELDGRGVAEVATGIGFFDHLLTLLARHSLIDLEVAAQGDLQVDEHHTVEDVALVLGRALDQALGERAGIRRYGQAIIPMDETLASCALDLGGRSYADVEPRPDPLAGLNGWLELLPHFVETLAREARFGVHLDVRKARSTHHLVEAAIKALARALREAVEPDPRLGDAVPSSKGTLR